MEGIYTELVLYGTKNECARTDYVFSLYLRSAVVRFPFNSYLKLAKPHLQYKYLPNYLTNFNYNCLGVFIAVHFYCS